MKLNVVKARTGSLWVRQGIRNFWRQPLALSGLFLLFMALASTTLNEALEGVSAEDIERAKRVLQQVYDNLK